MTTIITLGAVILYLGIMNYIQHREAKTRESELLNRIMALTDQAALNNFSSNTFVQKQEPPPPPTHDEMVPAGAGSNGVYSVY